MCYRNEKTKLLKRAAWGYILAIILTVKIKDTLLNLLCFNNSEFWGAFCLDIKYVIWCHIECKNSMPFVWFIDLVCVLVSLMVTDAEPIDWMDLSDSLCKLYSTSFQRTVMEQHLFSWRTMTLGCKRSNKTEKQNIFVAFCYFHCNVYHKTPKRMSE